MGIENACGHRHPRLWGMQTKELLHDEEQEEDTGQAFSEEVLSSLSNPYGSQGNKMKNDEGQ
jgi:hypothetical protein